MEQQRIEELNRLYAACCEALERGEAAAAKRGFATLCAECGEAPLLQSCYGLACYELQEFAEAEKAFARAAELEPAEYGHRANLGLALRRLGKNEAAEQLWRQVLEEQPQECDTLYNLAGLLRQRGGEEAFVEAVELLHRVVALQPENAAARNNLAWLLHRQGAYEAAVEQYRQVAALRPGDGGARHMLAALTGEGCETPPPDYVARLFDDFAAHFDDHLTARLDYKVPQLLFTLYQRAVPLQKERPALLDLGCGSGLCGAAFAGIASSMDGVDLSAKMVAAARERGIYATLAVAELVVFLQEATTRWQLFTAADVCNYFGDLRPLFTAVAACAEPGALLLFSSEEGDGAITLQSSGRFCHGAEALRQLLGECGFTVMLEEQAVLRQEGGEPVAGRLWCVRCGVESEVEHQPATELLT